MSFTLDEKMKWIEILASSSTGNHQSSGFFSADDVVEEIRKLSDFRAVRVAIFTHKGEPESIALSLLPKSGWMGSVSITNEKNEEVRAMTREPIETAYSIMYDYFNEVDLWKSKYEFRETLSTPNEIQNLKDTFDS